MRHKSIIMVLALYTVVVASAAAAPRAEAVVPSNCPDVFGIPGECSMTSSCQDHADRVYDPGCEVICSSCSTDNGWDCRTSGQQC